MLPDKSYWKFCEELKSHRSTSTNNPKNWWTRRKQHKVYCGWWPDRANDRRRWELTILHVWEKMETHSKQRWTRDRRSLYSKSKTSNEYGEQKPCFLDNCWNTRNIRTSINRIKITGLCNLSTEGRRQQITEGEKSSGETRSKITHWKRLVERFPL